MLLSLRSYFVAIVIFLLSIHPENLSRSALPHRSEFLSQNDEVLLYRQLMPEKVGRIDDLLNRYSWFNGNLMIVKNHKVIYQHSDGFANFRTREPLKVESVFELASISKQFTAIAVLILFERKLICLDDPLLKYIPELPYQNITIRNLLHHTSGLPNYMWVLENKWEQAFFPSNEEMIKMLVAHSPNIFFQSGRRYSYSNTGYALLASVVERVSGMSFSQFMRQNIFEPFGMNNTFTSVEILDSIYAIPRLALGHRQSRHGPTPTTHTVHDRVLGDKGIYSNLEDLYKWDQALYTENLVKNATLKQAYIPLTLTNQRKFPYGFGFRIGENDGERFVYHHGHWKGNRTSFMRYIERGNAIIIFNNTNQRLNTQIIGQVENILDEPHELSPTQQLALCVIYEGLPDALEKFEKMSLSGEIRYPDAQELFRIAGLLREINKPLLSNRIYHFYEKTNPGSNENPSLAGRRF